MPEATSPSAAASAVPLSFGELEALGLGDAESAVDLSFKLSGFADFSSYLPINPRGLTTLALPRYQSFFIGNFNVYISKNLSESFRTMGEVRFTYLPNGALSTTANTFGYTDTSTLDYANSSRQTRWGGIMLQRLYLEWTIHRLITVRGGQFLTPYGIWNVDHGSPTFIPVARPFVINNSLFPEWQTGLEIFGRWDFSNHGTLGYHLTLSNGTGPLSDYRDLDKNKAIGGRLYWEHHGAAYLRIGASGYFGRHTSSAPSFTLLPDGNVEPSHNITNQYDALALAADLLLKFRGIHFQAEWASQQRRYTDAGRALHTVFFATVPQAFSVDAFSWGVYALAAYQFDWLGLMPFVMVEYEDEIQTSLLIDAKLISTIYHIGINVHPIDAVTLKCAYVISTLRGGKVYSGDVQNIQLQAAWAF